MISLGTPSQITASIEASDESIIIFKIKTTHNNRTNDLLPIFLLKYST